MTGDTVVEPAPTTRPRTRQQYLRRTPSRPGRARLARYVAPGSTTERAVLWTAGIVLFMILWELAALLMNDGLKLPGFLRTVEAAWDQFVVEGSIYPHIQASLGTLAVGFGISVLFVPLGLVVGSSAVAKGMVNPVLVGLYALPGIALIPLAVVWFGVGKPTEVFIVVLEAAVVLMITVVGAVGTVDKGLHEVADAFDAGGVRRFLTITVPGTVPFLFTALRLGIGRALVGVVGVEIFTSNVGLGYLLTYQASTFRTADVFVVLVVIATLGGLLTMGIDMLGRRADRWKV